MIATQVYEKGPQTLAHAISEVEKLQAAQQLTATLILSSMVNVMSHEEDHCFECQESGHRTQHCPNACCFECDEYGHIVVLCNLFLLQCLTFNTFVVFSNLCSTLFL